MLERKEKEHGEEGEKDIPITRELSEREKDTDKQERRERIKETRCNRGLRGEKECKRKENDGEIQTWEGGERTQVLDGRRERGREKNGEKDIWKRRERTEKERVEDRSVPNADVTSRPSDQDEDGPPQQERSCLRNKTSPSTINLDP
ncbi:putative uncharacterized protein DDB_G0271982 [Tenebrio molitor]|uniref:putative uncharacterized protein DDB_G0271982 n=1 Tax=Tenebrio molitor TaxID=7067 RepID=UPI003624A89D